MRVPDRNFGTPEPSIYRVERRGNRRGRNATHRRQQPRFAAFYRPVQNEERPDIIAIPTHVGVENNRQWHSWLLALRSSGDHAEQAEQAEQAARGVRDK